MRPVVVHGRNFVFKVGNVDIEKLIAYIKRRLVLLEAETGRRQAEHNQDASIMGISNID